MALSRMGDASIAAYNIDDDDFATLLEGHPVDYPSKISEAEISLMLYTSGTTGRPKGVPRSHRAERLAATHCVAQLCYKHGESTLGVMPMFHTMGVRSMLMCLLLNSKLVCLPVWDPEDAMRLIQEEKIDTLFLVPTMFHDMLHHPKRSKYDLLSAQNIGIPVDFYLQLFRKTAHN